MTALILNGILFGLAVAFPFFVVGGGLWLLGKGLQALGKKLTDAGI